MTVIIFILVLVALIVVHEFGHFIVAKLSGMRVEEFGLGYPPRVATLWKKGDTEYTLNALPFGGFVRIYGEDGLGDADARVHGKRAFTDKNRFVQAVVLVAGILMNLLFAWILISVTLFIGTPRALSDAEVPYAQNPQLTISEVLPGSPAAAAGLLVGDVIQKAFIGDAQSTTPTAAAFTSFVSKDTKVAPVTLDVLRNGKEILLSVVPKAGVIATDPARPAIGVGLATVATVPVAWYKAPIEGATLTWEITKEIGAGLVHFFASIFTFTADLSQVSGPVGIAGAVGSAARAGAASLLTITALISINLALINLIPMPALDGGRLLFVIIESITRRPIKAKVAQTLNTIGFALLILLMVVVTVHDIFKIVG
jgi:regulator of sigma E protease